MTPSETLFLAAIFAGATLLVFYRFHDGSGEDARRLTIDRMNTVMAGLESYAIDNAGGFPTTDQGLKALVGKPAAEPVPREWRGPYVRGPEALTDAWGMPLNYVSPGGKNKCYDLWSNGADKAEGGEGPAADIQSWDRATLSP
ncbi:MAG TPA: type II secretion system protein GspG [Armatimonadota bacterium]|nr:type II secretion system protein GspG [Armatimonadota bacterium]